ncbi:WD40/YVTN/BNR-like repeat-containing protein [Holdemanella porci]|uniref:WD40/YVTN/BNR-like repeat-containing protein n=1 Tax=Holdemanella porci TaxID=2652276 RepID=UPI003F8EBF9A
MKIIDNARALFQEKDKIWIAKGNTFYSINYDGNVINKKISVGGFVENFVSRNRFIRQLFRIGIHHIIKLRSGNFLITKRKKTLIIDKNGNVLNVFQGYSGNKPFHQGICETPDGTIFFAEYTQNFKRECSSCLYRSIDGGFTFEPILTFTGNQVRHIHFVNFDKFQNKVWVGTGDDDNECKIMCTSDNGNTWKTIGEGSQKWRAIGLCFTENYILWGTDAGNVEDQNALYSMNRVTKEIKKICDIEGPCHGCSQIHTDLFLFSTGVEGGKNEKDKYVRIKIIKNSNVQEIFKMKKDNLPYVVQFGVVRFPLRNGDVDKIVFTSYGLCDGGEKVYIYE